MVVIRVLSLACTLSMLFAAVQSVAGQESESTRDIRVDSLTLDRNTITLGCPPGVRSPGECNDSRTIRAKATVSGIGAKGSRLETTVSGGRTIRVSDLEFDWDLSYAGPGTYTITVGVIDKDGRFGGPQTAVVTVEQCKKCIHVDSCPVLSITGPSSLVQPGENMTFTAKVSGPALDFTYNWSISAGTIVSGQGTPSIQVQTERSMGGTSVTATVELGGQQTFMACPTSASETGVVDQEPRARLVDEFRTGGGNCEEGFARMDSFYTELNNNPNARGVVMIYTDSGQLNSGRWRKLTLNNHIRMRHFDGTRITFIDAPLIKDATTQFWIVPPGADIPVPVVGEGPAPKYSNTRPTKPYMYAAEYGDGIPGCFGNLYDIEAYAAELNSEPKSRGRIVIAESSQARYGRHRAEILAELRKYNVAGPRITTVYKYVRRNRLLESTELWVVPITKTKR